MKSIKPSENKRRILGLLFVTSGVLTFSMNSGAGVEGCLAVAGGTQLVANFANKAIVKDIASKTLPLRTFKGSDSYISSGSVLATCKDSVIVITAAHNLVSNYKNLDSKVSVEVVNVGINRTTLTDDELTEQVNGIAPTKVIISDSYLAKASNFGKQGFSNMSELASAQKRDIISSDIAFLVIPKGKLSSGYETLKIPSREKLLELRQGGGFVRVQGYGRTIIDDSFSKGTLSFGLMKFWEKQKVADNPGQTDFVFESLNQGVSCNGDSGGPIHFSSHEGTYLVGLVSGGDCRKWTFSPDLTSPGVQAEVASMLKKVSGIDCSNPFEGGDGKQDIAVLAK